MRECCEWSKKYFEEAKNSKNVQHPFSIRTEHPFPLCRVCFSTGTSRRAHRSSHQRIRNPKFKGFNTLIPQMEILFFPWASIKYLDTARFPINDLATFRERRQSKTRNSLRTEWISSGLVRQIPNCRVWGLCSTSRTYQVSFYTIDLIVLVANSPRTVSVRSDVLRTKEKYMSFFFQLSSFVSFRERVVLDHEPLPLSKRVKQ